MLGVPLLLWLVLPPYAILPMVWTMALFCHSLTNRLLGEKGRNWWNRAGVTRGEVMRILARFVICALLMTGATYLLQPELLFGFVRTKPQFWAVVMVMYPLISVVPQEIIFRRYIFARFERLMTPTMLILLSGLGFGFAHIVFNNWIAPALCAVGGVMFAQTYLRTRSLALVSLEHALYGNFVFTLGLGRYFYHGAVQ